MQICCIITWKAGSLVTRQKDLNLLHFTWKRRFSHDAPKRCKFVALLLGKSGLPMTHQKLLNLFHYYVKKQVFSWRAKKVQICCSIKGKSRFSHDVQKRCKFVALLSGKAGVFFMTHKKGANLLHYYVEKQVFSWRAKTLKVDALLRGKTGFLVTCQNS